KPSENLHHSPELCFPLLVALRDFCSFSVCPVFVRVFPLLQQREVPILESAKDLRMRLSALRELRRGHCRSIGRLDSARGGAPDRVPVPTLAAGAVGIPAIPVR